MKTRLSTSGPEHDTAPTLPRLNRSSRILVVDDDEAVRELSVLALVRAGYEVDAAADGAAGWEALRANAYDLLFTDHNMPNVTGVELVERLRAERMGLVVILTSGLFPEEELNRHPSLQLAATLQKPFSFDELVSTVKEVLAADLVNGSNGANGSNGEGTESRHATGA